MKTELKTTSEIRDKFTGFFTELFGLSRIKKIIFFTPEFNDSKPDTSNYSCVIVTDGIDNNWVIVYRPSYVRNIQNDVFIQRIEKGTLTTEVENKLNGDYPILAAASSLRSDTLDKPFVRVWNLPSDAKYNPDKYILPFDVVKRESSVGFHFAIYLGNNYVAHLTGGGGEGTVFDTWYKFCNPNSGSSSSGSSSSSSASILFPFSSLSSSSSSSSLGSSSNNLEITAYHPLIPFKRKEEIIRHVAKVVSCRYGSSSYEALSNNCEHLANNCVFGIHVSKQAEVAAKLAESAAVSMLVGGPLEEVNSQRDLDNLTFSYYYERETILKHIKKVEDNRPYTRSKYQIEQEKFQERIEVYPKDWCRIQ